jgi:hypothetical protein
LPCSERLIRDSLTRICEFARRLHQLHRAGDDDAIDREFSAVCRAIWGYTLDDFDDDDLSAEDHAWPERVNDCETPFVMRLASERV